MKRLLQIFASKSEISQGSWALTLPKDWALVGEEDGVVSIAAGEGVGALQLSSFVKEGLVTDSDLIELLEEMGGQRYNSITARQGEFTGFVIDQVDNNTWFRSWFLRCNSTMVYSTYNCNADHKGAESQTVDDILSSLTYRRQ